MLTAASLIGALLLQTVPAGSAPHSDGSFAFPGSPARAGRFWDSVFEAARNSPPVRKALFDLVAGADSTVNSDTTWYRRPTRFEEIPQSQVDGLASTAGPNRDVRALAMNDCRQADYLRSKGVGLAIAARYTSNSDYVQKIIEILGEVAQWQPFQRPGWSLGDPDRRMPPGGDGVNMATAWGVHGVIDILEILGDRIPEALRHRLRERLRSEVAAIVDSWSARRPWYVQSDAAMSNQWIDPSAALIRACLYLGEPELADEYELGVRNVTKSLGMSASDGAFLEGVTYAQMSFGPLFEALMAMKDAGDDRLQGHPFVQSAWNWFLHQLMPCGALVNCSDSHMSLLPDWALRSPLDGLSMAALASGSREATGAVRALFPEVPATPVGFRLALAEPVAGTFPADIAPWGYFPSQQLVTWREAFRPPTDHRPEMGIWIKGGSPLCRSHAHRDQGHVSVYRGCDALLMECGTPDYSDPGYAQAFASAAGHGIMQVNPVAPHSQAVEAPIAVRKLDASGGHVEIELQRAYLGVRAYRRAVQWSANTVQIHDEVSFLGQVPSGSELFRFHLGSADPMAIEISDNGWKVRIAGATVKFSASDALSISAQLVSDRIRPPYRHQVLVICCTRAIEGTELVTEIVMEPEPKSN